MLRFFVFTTACALGLVAQAQDLSHGELQALEVPKEANQAPDAMDLFGGLPAGGSARQASTADLRDNPDTLPISSLREGSRLQLHFSYQGPTYAKLADGHVKAHTVTFQGGRLLNANDALTVDEVYCELFFEDMGFVQHPGGYSASVRPGRQDASGHARDFVSCPPEIYDCVYLKDASHIYRLMRCAYARPETQQTQSARGRPRLSLARLRDVVGSAVSVYPAAGRAVDSVPQKFLPINPWPQLPSIQQWPPIQQLPPIQLPPPSPPKGGAGPRPGSLFDSKMRGRL